MTIGAMRALSLRTFRLAVVLLVSAGIGAGTSLTGQASATTRPSWEIIGTSTQDRPIRVSYRGPTNPTTRVLAVGCIHGDECAAVKVIRRLARQKDPRRVGLWLIPTVNPDGRALGTRQNARGVDLNRNFPWRWRPIGLRGDRFYSGPRSRSERETRLVMRFVRQIRPDLTIWFHQREVNVRQGGGPTESARRYARLVGLPFLALPIPNGAATGWQISTFPGSEAFVVELPSGRLSAVDAERHKRAVRTVARRLASSG